MREDNPARKTPPAKRRQEVAAILAAGVLRHRRMAQKAASRSATESCDLPGNSLGRVRQTRPCVPAGSGGHEAREPEKGHGA